MQRRSIAIASTIVAAAGLAACRLVPWPLEEGDAAPALDVSHWLQGARVDPRQDRAITVAECWATWCGPCVGAIPHLDALQRRYADQGVRVVAVSAWDDVAAVQRFVADRGTELSYAIAADDSGSFRWHWRQQLFGGWHLPFSFVVDRDGTVVYRGHPGGLDGIVAGVLAGDHDLDRARRLDAAWETLWRAGDDGDWTRLERLADELLRTEPQDASAWAHKIVAQQDPEAAAATARAAAEALGALPLRLATVTRIVARRDRLDACAPVLDQALDRAAESSATRALAVPMARLLCAAANGADARRQSTAAIAAGLATRPHDLFVLAEDLAWWRGPETGAGAAAAEERTAAALQLVEAAAQALAAPHVARLHFTLLARTDASDDRIDEAGRTVVAGLEGRLGELNSFAWQILTDEQMLPAGRATALRAAEAMTRCAGHEQPMFLDTIAMARFENGQIDAAIELQQRAIAALGEGGGKDAYAARLQRYLAARGARVEQAERAEAAATEPARSGADARR